MIKNIIRVLISNFAVTIVGIFNSFVFPVLMSIDEYAGYHEFILYVSYINICHLGIATGMFLNYGGKDYKQINKEQYCSEITLLIRVLFIFSVIGVLAAAINGSFLLWVVVISIFPVCLNASFKSLYQAWGRFTEYSLLNALPNIGITVLALCSYFITGRLSERFIICVYIAMNYLTSFWFLKEYAVTGKGVKRNKLLTPVNIATVKNGFFIMLGNYINNLFHVSDKQFVNIFFGSHNFAMYSFGMTTQNLMTVFISSVAQPFYPKLAQNKLNRQDLLIIKELMFAFGSISGCAYFAVEFVISRWIPKYTESLQIVEIFFLVFPAMAVINVIYINLYKVTRQIKRYISTLIFMLVLSVLLNGLVVWNAMDYTGIAIATVGVYYIWLVYSQYHFDDLKISVKDYIYLGGYFAIYCTIINGTSPILGFFIYGIIIMCWNTCFYRKSVMYAVSRVLKI
ncbi:MAG: lipopolysaccharide biosynthesis protein [Lachnospiraceae bacterium]